MPHVGQRLGRRLAPGDEPGASRAGATKYRMNTKVATTHRTTTPRAMRRARKVAWRRVTHP